MENQGLYTVEDIVQSLITEYSLSTAGEGDVERYRQQVYRALHDTGIWKQGIKKSWKKRNKPLHGKSAAAAFAF